MNTRLNDLSDLYEERDFLLRSLRDLDAEQAAGDLDDADYAALRDDYTARTAAVLRAIEAAASPNSAPKPGGGRRRTVERAQRRSWKPVVGVLLVVVVATLAGLALAASSGDRVGNQAETGSIDAGTTDNLAQARALIGAGKVLDAIKMYDKVLKTDPKNPEALAYRGWLVKLAGLSSDGLAYIDRAIAADPAYPDAHFFRGMILMQDQHNPAAAIPEFQRFLASNPPSDMVPLVQGALQQAEAAVGAPPPAPATTTSAPPAPTTTPAAP